MVLRSLYWSMKPSKTSFPSHVTVTKCDESIVRSNYNTGSLLGRRREPTKLSGGNP
jgi:hypothetical protein